MHAYVGDEVIVTWPLSDDPKRNARSLRCFIAAEHRIADLAPDYTREFGVAPQFRAGVHAGPVVVSECGDTKRQIALFGDTINVAARLCDHSEAAGEALVASADMLTGTAIPPGLSVGSPSNLTLRGGARLPSRPTRCVARMRCAGESRMLRRQVNCRGVEHACDRRSDIVGGRSGPRRNA